MKDKLREIYWKYKALSWKPILYFIHFLRRPVHTVIFVPPCFVVISSMIISCNAFDIIYPSHKSTQFLPTKHCVVFFYFLSSSSSFSSSPSSLLFYELTKSNLWYPYTLKFVAIHSKNGKTIRSLSLKGKPYSPPLRSCQFAQISSAKARTLYILSLQYWACLPWIFTDLIHTVTNTVWCLSQGNIVKYTPEKIILFSIEFKSIDTIC